MPHLVRLSGEITDVFAHRFVLSSDGKRYLADIGPEGAKMLNLQVGARIAIEGEQKPSEIKVSQLSIGGEKHKLEWPEAKHRQKAEHPPFRLELAAAVKSATDAGYEVVGDPNRKPRHFELLVRKDDQLAEIHVGEDGQIRKTRPVSPADPKWRDALDAR